LTPIGNFKKEFKSKKFHFQRVVSYSSKRVLTEILLLLEIKWGGILQGDSIKKTQKKKNETFGGYI
jgi:hypothetical protein